MAKQDDRRRPPLYWFKHKHGEYIPLPFPPLSGAHPFCFFRSREYAREFLCHWVPEKGLEKPWTSQGISRNDWIIDGDNNADRLLAVCDEVAQEGYEAFLVDPPLTSLQGLDTALTRSLVDIKGEIEDRAAWQ
jgi:hypothetical protein